MPTFALNFYSPVVADQLRTGRKTATIRLGDKSAKYRKGMIVHVLVGARDRGSPAGHRNGPPDDLRWHTACRDQALLAAQLEMPAPYRPGPTAMTGRRR